MAFVHNKFLLLCSILVIALVQPSINFGQHKNITDPSQAFYPTPTLAYKSYPNLYFQIGNFIHIRDALTGVIIKTVKLDEGEQIVDCTKTAMLLLSRKTEDGNNHYRRIDSDGKSESFTFKDSKSLGINGSPCDFVFFNGKPYAFYQTGDPTNHDYKFIVVEQDGKLWTVTNNEGETWFYIGFFSTNNKFIVKIACIKNNTDIFSLKLFDLLTGTLVDTLEGCFENESINQYSLNLIPLQTCVQNRELLLYDINLNKIVYRKTIPNWFYTKPSNDAIWLTFIEDKSNQYRFGDSGPIRIVKIGLDGKELENFTIMPTLPNIPIYSCQIATDQVGALLAKNKTILYNFRTNQKLLDLDLDLPEIYFGNGKILFVTTSELVCVDDETFSFTWKLDVARSGYIHELVTDKKLYLINKTYDFKNQCEAAQIKIINKADNSLEPYEFFVSPFSGGDKNIYDSPYGLVLISDNNICSFAVGGIERFSIKGLSGIKSWKVLDDPRYVEIKFRYDQTYRLDTRTGSFVHVSTKTQNNRNF